MKLGANSSIYGSYLKDIEAKHRWKEEVGGRKQLIEAREVRPARLR